MGGIVNRMTTGGFFMSPLRAKFFSLSTVSPTLVEGS